MSDSIDDPGDVARTDARPSPNGVHRAMFWTVAAMLGAGAVAGVYGVTQIVTHETAARAEVAEEADEPRGNHDTVTLPDKDGDGVPDGYEEPLPEKPDTPGEPEPEKPIHEEPRSGPEPKPKPAVYAIESGDTLSEISGETGVPLDVLVDANGIDDPNLIYAGASLVIPPVG